jgi:RNA polymerase sigma-B factor
METLSMRNTSGRAAALSPATPALPSRTLEGLARLDDLALLHIVQSQPARSPRRTAACELLVARHRNLVASCVQRYKRSPEPAEDLMQVGYVGLLKAINNFNPDLGGSLTAYAQPCISGEIKRHFRDKRWQVHVERSMQELVLQVRDATKQLTQQLGHQPADQELASHLGISNADLRQARVADLVFQPASLDAPLAGRPDAATLADVLGEEDPAVQRTIDMESVAAHWDELPRREQKILLLRFYGDMTQAEIGQQLSISQMHVSRLLAHALVHLRHRLLGPAQHKVGARTRPPGPASQSGKRARLVIAPQLRATMTGTAARPAG